MNITNKGKIARLFIYIFIFSVFFMVFFTLMNSAINKNNIIINLKADCDFEMQFFYNTNEVDFLEERSFIYNIKKCDEYKKYKVNLPTNNIDAIRLDIGRKENINVYIKQINISLFDKELQVSELSKYEKNQLNIFNEKISTTGEDGYFIISNIQSDLKYKNNYMVLGIISFVFASVLTFMFYKYVAISELTEFPMDVIKNKTLIIKLGKNDFKTKYSGSYFGIVWAFVQPICQILVFWFVFEVGLRSGGIDDVPFVLWLMAGLIPWFYFSESWQTATNAFMDYSYLVKKVVFNINILPVVKIISAFFVHCFFVIFMLLVYCAYDKFPDFYTIQILYYTFAMSALVLSLSLITSSLIVFFKDLGQFMNIILQFGMWLTPIMWHIEPIPWFFKLNPMYYIVQGYRNSLINKVPFYNDITQMIYFWFVTFVFFVIGSVLLKRLKPHFADVL